MLSGSEKEDPLTRSAEDLVSGAYLDLKVQLIVGAVGAKLLEPPGENFQDPSKSFVVAPSLTNSVANHSTSTIVVTRTILFISAW